MTKPSSNYIHRPIWLVPLLLIVAVGLMMPFDVTIAQFAREGDYSGELVDILNVAESYGNGVGAVMILIAIGICLPVSWPKPKRRRVFWRLVLMSLGSGLMADIFKMIVERTRPRAIEEFAGYGWHSFQSVFPLVSAGSDGQSFPSAHSATAAGLSVALAWMFPRATGFFAVLAILVMVQRVQCGAHFPSDVLAGAAVGLLFARLCRPHTSLELFGDQ